MLSYYFNTQFPPKLRHLSCHGTRFSVHFQLIQARALCYQLSCHNCYCIAIISKSAAANISFQRREHTAWRRNCRYTKIRIRSLKRQRRSGQTGVVGLIWKEVTVNELWQTDRVTQHYSSTGTLQELLLGKKQAMDSIVLARNFIRNNGLNHQSVQHLFASKALRIYQRFQYGTEMAA